MEQLLAFFRESTFIGQWIFGWNKLPPRLYLATIWVAGDTYHRLWEAGHPGRPA